MGARPGTSGGWQWLSFRPRNHKFRRLAWELSSAVAILHLRKEPPMKLSVQMPETMDQKLDMVIKLMGAGIAVCFLACLVVLFNGRH